MKRRIFGILVLAAACTPVAAEPGPVAVTFDDLPLQGPSGRPVEQLVHVNERLLETLEATDIPAVGFVNEQKLESGGRPDPARVAILEAWLDAGLELGNHTYSHPDLHRVALSEYLGDIERGEVITRPLAEARGTPYRYFRHPFLRTGLDLRTRDTVRAFLDDHGYTVAPVTIDNSEWIFSAAYDRAHAEGNETLKRRVGTAYVDYMLAKTDFFERNAMELFGRPIHQVLLVHVNRLNADWFGKLANELGSGGRSFVSLEKALADPAYDSPDEWTGSGGISWLHRWALARGVPKSFYAGEPETPGWVMDLAGIESE